MGIDQISKHDHSSDADGGKSISPTSVSTEKSIMKSPRGEAWQRILLGRFTADADQGVTVTDAELGSYDEYVIRLEGMVVNGGGSSLRLQVNGDSTANYTQRVIGNSTSNLESFDFTRATGPSHRGEILIAPGPGAIQTNWRLTGGDVGEHIGVGRSSNTNAPLTQLRLFAEGSNTLSGEFLVFARSSP
jgi:hypothetical protein